MLATSWALVVLVNNDNNIHFQAASHMSIPLTEALYS